MILEHFLGCDNFWAAMAVVLALTGVLNTK